MKNILLALAAVLAFGLTGMTSAAEIGAKHLNHLVGLKFTTTATKAQIDAVVAAFRDLKEKVPGVVRLEWGPNISPEKHDKGFTHIFLISFASEKDRDAYLVHPEHKVFGKLLAPVMDDVFVVDFWAHE